MITIKKLKWGYLFSYGNNNEIDFTTDTLTQILGVNGNGKSSIALILEEAIFNKNSKGIKKADIANRNFNEGYWIKLYFSKDEDNYEVHIDRKSTLKIKLLKNEEDISSHTATNTFKTLETIFEMDFKMFSQLINQNASSSLQFLTATDTNRKKFLIEIFRLSRYVELFEVFKSAAREELNYISSIRGSVETIEQWIKQNTTVDLELKELEEHSNLDYSSDEVHLTSLRNQLATIEATNKKIANNINNIKLFEDIDIDSVQKTEASYNSYDSIQETLGGVTANLSRRRAYVSKLKQLSSDTCPTCEQPIEQQLKNKLIEEEEIEIHNLLKQAEKLNNEIDNIKKVNNIFNVKQATIQNWENLYRSIDRSLPQALFDKEVLEQEIDELVTKISRIKTKISSIILANQKAEAHNSRVRVYLEQSEKFIKELEIHQTKLAHREKILYNLEALKKAFSTNGFIAYKIENLVKDLEDLTNSYLAELSDGRFTIEFAVSSDKLDVIITDQGTTVDIQALSSGELARVNTATLLALRNLMNSLSNSEINVLFLDEVIGVLDDLGKERLVEVLLQESLNTYIVSHGWQHPLLAKLEVLRDNERSYIEYGQ
jgi:DNA repair exonuclease SbcCD ATPase subunit